MVGKETSRSGFPASHGEVATMDPLVQAEWLARRRDEPGLVVLDATVQVRSFLGIPVMRSGRRGWRRGHVPGSGFADLVAVSSPDAPRRSLTMPSAEWFAAAMGRLGVGDGNRVVLYDSRENMWAARLWWMLRAFGFRDAAVLDGGWTAWRQAGLPVCSRPCRPAPATFVARPVPDLVVAKQDVLAAIDDPDACLVNALGRRQHRGEVNEYGRPGHIPGSRNLTAWEVLDRRTQRYRPLAELQDKAGPVLDSKRVITYCGGGVAASSVALVLTRLGHEHVAVYDGGLQEWCADPSLPLELGP